MDHLLKVLFFISIASSWSFSYEFCEIDHKNGVCRTEKNKTPMTAKARFILYDVNPPEGFNLRRDVYMRMAVFARKLRDDNWWLVLPPWPHLYHWTSDDIPQQGRLPWSLFFNMTTLISFAPVVEMSDFLQTGQKQIEQVYVLQHFQDMFTSNNFEDRYEVTSCNEPLMYNRNPDGFDGHFWGYKNLTAKIVECLSFHGPASQLKNIIDKGKYKAKTVMFDHAEVVLHDRFGDKDYWDARKSMKFSDNLVKEANRFRAEKLNSSLPANDAPWPNLKRTAMGDDYICVHLRRRDFLYGRKNDVPSIKGASDQIDKALKELNLQTVFVATDSPTDEKLKLKKFLEKYNVVYYEPTKEIRTKYKDGGVAIVEQIICSHSRKFYGTHESTFSFRIQEEREIMGFRPEMTFNRMCGDKDSKCKPPSKWLIVN